MPILKNVLGLDVGSYSLKAVELRQGLRSLEVVRTHVERREADLPLHSQISRMLLTHSFQRENVVTALRADRVSMRRLEFPFGERRRVAQAVPFELEDQVPFDMDEMVLDWEVARRERSHAEVRAALAPRSEVSALIETLHQAGCDPRTIETEGGVLANLGVVFELPDPCLLVEVGHSKTTLCALRGGDAVGTRAIGIGGRAFTEAVAQERALSLDDAERYKLEHGVVEPGVNSLYPRADAVLHRLSNEILRFTSSIERLGGGETLVLLGGGAQLPWLGEWLTERTGLPAAPLGLPRPDSGLAGLAAEGAPGLLAPAVALAVRGTARAATQINLRQDDFARRTDFTRFRRDFGTTGVLAAAVVGLALVSFTTGAILESREAGRVDARVAALWAESFPDRPLPDDPIAAMREQVRQAKERAEFLGVYRGNMSALDVLTEISRLVPKSLDVGFEELSIDKQTIRIRVYASSFEAADRLGAELAKFRPFEQARIGAIETDRRTGGKKFNVTIGLSGEGTGESG